MESWIAWMGWQGWIILSGVLGGLAQAIGKRQVGYMSSFQSGILRDGTVLIIMMGIVMMQGIGSWSSYNWVWIVIGLLESVMMAAYYSASREELSSTVIFSYPLSSVLIVGLSGVLFGEWQYFDPREWRGLINIFSLILIVVLMMIYQGGKLKSTRWSTKLVLSSLMVVVANLVTKWAVSTLGVRPSDYILYEYIGLVIGGIIYVTARKQGMKVGLSQIGWGVMQGLLFAFSILLMVEIVKYHPLSLVSMTRRIATVAITVVMGLWWYKEGSGMSTKQKVSLAGAIGIMGLMMGN